jgi:hypothetical protein
VSGGWRDGQAAVYDFYVGELETALAELDNLEAIFTELDEPKMAAETRGYAGGVRAVRATLIGRARELRTSPEAGTVLPMSLTTRRVRSAEDDA